MNTIATMLPETLKRPALIELIDSLASYGNKTIKARAAELVRPRKGTNAERRELIIELATRARKRRQVHALSLGFAFCKVEAGHEDPSLVDLLTTPTTKGEDVTCPACRKLMGLDDEEAQAELAAEAERVAEIQAEQARKAAVKRKREAAIRKAVAADPGTSTATTQAIRFGLDDGAGTDLADPASSLPIVFPYKGTDHEARLMATTEVELNGTTYPSPSAAGAAVTGNAVNGWRRWRYEAKDGELYPIARLRGEDHKPVRVGRTGRRPTESGASTRLEAATRRVEKTAARIEATESKLADLRAKLEAAQAELEAARAAAVEVGLEVEAPAPAAEAVDLYPELGMFYGPAEEGAFAAGQGAEVYALGGWKRGEITRVAGGHVTVLYTNGSGVSREVLVSLTEVATVNPYGRAGGRKRGGSALRTPDVQALRVRVPAALRAADDAADDAAGDQVEVQDGGAQAGVA